MFVCRVPGSAWMVLQRLTFSPLRSPSPSPAKDTSGAWPMAEMTISTGSRVSDPATGTGRRRPLASGSPNSMRRTSRWVTFPCSSATT